MAALCIGLTHLACSESCALGVGLSLSLFIFKIFTLSNTVAQLTKEGKIVPSYVTVKLLDNAMKASPVKKFLIDGFPRNAENNDQWVKDMQEHCDMKFVLFFECPEDVMQERLLSRGVSSGRNDDNIESIKKRFNTFKEQTLEVIKYYEDQGKVQRVNSDRDITLIYEDVKALFETI